MILFNPWDRRQWIFHSPGTDTCCFITLVQLADSNQTRPSDRYLLLYYPQTDTCCFTTLGQTLHRLAPLRQTVYGLSAPGTDVPQACPPWDKQSVVLFPLGHSLADSDSLDSLLLFVRVWFHKTTWDKYSTEMHPWGRHSTDWYLWDKWLTSLFILG